MNYNDLKDLIKYYKTKPITDSADIDVITIKYLEQLKSIYMIFNNDISTNDKIVEIESNVSKLNIEDVETKEIIKTIQAQLGLLLITNISNELGVKDIDN